MTKTPDLARAAELRGETGMQNRPSAESPEAAPDPRSTPVIAGHQAAPGASGGPGSGLWPGARAEQGSGPVARGEDVGGAAALDTDALVRGALQGAPAPAVPAGLSPARPGVEVARALEWNPAPVLEAAPSSAPVTLPAPGSAAVPVRLRAADGVRLSRHAAPGPGLPPTASPARLRPRHRGILASFFGLVLLPVLLCAGYLWLVAQDQFASTLGFSVRTEESSAALGLLGGLSRLSGGGGASDADILYDYIHSQELVADLDRQLDLRTIYARAWPQDRVFAFDPSGSIEDLVAHWARTVKVAYDTGTGLMTLRVLAFDPNEAQEVARQILRRSTEKVNELSQEAREDATRYSREEMERALERLKTARAALTTFRMTARVVDPVADLQGQMGVLNSLQAQLAESYVQLDLLRTTATPNDPRLTQLEQRITVIDRRLAEERRKFGEGGKGPGGEDYATLVAEFERLEVDRAFAEQTYHAALAAHDLALAAAQRKSRYLAAHIQPTLAEMAEYPARWTLLGLSGFFLLMIWSIGVLVFYSLRDRR